MSSEDAFVDFCGVRVVGILCMHGVVRYFLFFKILLSVECGRLDANNPVERYFFQLTSISIETDPRLLKTVCWQGAADRSSPRSIMNVHLANPDIRRQELRTQTRVLVLMECRPYVSARDGGVPILSCTIPDSTTKSQTLVRFLL